MYRRVCFHACAAFLLVALTASAQEAIERQDVPFASVGISEWISIVGIPAIPNLPFSATSMMENVRMLADGTTVTTKTMTTIARDSQGRTHNENRHYLRPSDNGEGRIRDITIFDPATRTRTTLTPATLQAHAAVLPPRQQLPESTLIRSEQQRVDLGLSTIDGITVRGFRQSQTIPEGQDGNNRPITITDEYWYSDELHMNITLKHDDPRYGTQSVVLTQLKRDEPDPKMFEIPSTYTVQNENYTQRTVRIGAAVAEANLIERVEPQYPPLAAAARVQGAVEFNLLIGEDGSVKNVQLVRGHPLLINAAKDAVLQWKYRPTLLNGNAVSVMAPAVVNFTAPQNN